MSQYKCGDVVFASIPFEEDPTKAKGRPVVIIEILEDDWYLVCKITHIDHSGIKKGRWIIKNSEQWKQMGLKQSSFVSDESTIEIPQTSIYMLLGTYPYIDDLTTDSGY